MEQFHYDGEGTLEAPDPKKTIVIEYHERKPFTGAMWFGIAITGLTLASGLIYALVTIFMFIIKATTN
jgi:hypothetical protein